MVCVSCSDAWWLARRHRIRSAALTAARAALSVAAALSGALTGAYMRRADALKTQDDFNEMLWNASHPGFAEHSHATRAEWALVCCFLLVIMTFSYEVYHNEHHFHAHYQGPVCTAERGNTHHFKEREGREIDGREIEGREKKNKNQTRRKSGLHLGTSSRVIQHRQ